MSAAEQEVREVSVAAENSLVQAVSKAELDQQITTAHAYPRSLKKFRDECLDMATLNEQVADECIYAVPRKEGNQVKMIEGPSARLAEIVASAWGNCRAGARIVSEERDFVTAQGVFHDLERNVAITYEVRRRITGKHGRFSADMISVTANAACSIALRNAVFKGVPKAFWADIYDAARKVCAGDAKTLANRRSNALSVLQKVGVTQEQVLATLGVGGVEDITGEHLTVLQGLRNSIRDGEITIEEAFAPKDQPTQTTNRAEQAKEALAKTAGEATGTAGGTGQKPGGDLIDDYVPHYDEKKALDEIGKCKNVATLDEVEKSVRADYEKSKRPLPDSIEPRINDRRESLKQKL